MTHNVPITILNFYFFLRKIFFYNVESKKGKKGYNKGKNKLTFFILKEIIVKNGKKELKNKNEQNMKE